MLSFLASERSLDEDIEEATSGEFKDFVMAILQGLRKDDFDETLVKAKAEAIFADEQGYFYYKYSKNQNI